MNFAKKLLQSSIATLSIVIVFFALILFKVIPFDNTIVVPFIIGAIILIIGETIFLVGIDSSIDEVGRGVGNKLMKVNKVWLIVLFGFIFGLVTAIAEPDINVLIGQIIQIDSFFSYWLLLSIFGIGTGLFVSIAVYRILRRVPFKVCITVLYAIVFILAALAPEKFLALSFDAGGSSTGSITVPFLLSMIIGLCAIRSSSSKEDSFGAVAIASVGPIIAVLILGLFSGPSSSSVATTISTFSFTGAVLDSLKSVAIAILPLIVIFIISQFTLLKYPAIKFFKILIGFIISGVGLVLFLIGINYGFLTAGNFMGQYLTANTNLFVIIIVGAILGFLLVFTDPAIIVLAEKVEKVAFIKKEIVYVVIGIGIAAAVALGFLRAYFQFSIWYILLPCYVVACIFAFIVPPIFSSIAFDSGGIASGTMTVSFIIPIGIGICSSMAGDALLYAFGISALVATMPILSVEAFGLIYLIKSKKKRASQVKVIKLKTPKPVNKKTKKIINVDKKKNVRYNKKEVADE